MAAPQVITLQFGPAADRLGAFFWNGQDAVQRWAQHSSKMDLVPKSVYFTAKGHPRLVSVLPVEASELIGESADLAIGSLSTADRARELFPSIQLDKKSVQRLPLARSSDTFNSGMLCGMSLWTEAVLDATRLFAEECDRLDGIQAMSGDDQLGGFGSQVMQDVADEYGKKDRIVYSLPPLDDDWAGRALSLYAYSHTPQVPFSLMRPKELAWTVPSYDPLAVFAGAMDTSQGTSEYAGCRVLRPDIGSLAFGMRLKVESGGAVKPVIDLLSFSSPSFEAIFESTERRSVPCYVKMNGHGYLPHHTVAVYGRPLELCDYLHDLIRHTPRIPGELHYQVIQYLQEQSS